MLSFLQSEVFVYITNKLSYYSGSHNDFETYFLTTKQVTGKQVLIEGLNSADYVTITQTKA